MITVETVRPTATSSGAVARDGAGRVVHLRGYGLVLVFRIDAPDGVAEYWATGDLTMDAGVRRQHAELGFAIENYHRELKRNCGVERSQARSEHAQRDHIGLALRAWWSFEVIGMMVCCVMGGVLW